MLVDKKKKKKVLHEDFRFFLNCGLQVLFISALHKEKKVQSTDINESSKADDASVHQ